MRMTRDIPGGIGCNVYLDGEQLRYCIEADDEQGWVKYVIETPDGRPIASEIEPDGVLAMRVGVVTFTFDPPEERAKAEAWHAERRSDGVLAS